MKKKIPLIFGAFLLGIMIFISLFGPWLAPHDPQSFNLSLRLAEPSWDAWMGRDQNGADVFSQVLYGARVSIGVALAVVSMSLIIGVLLGALAGYSRGWVDSLIMRIVDVFFAFPGFLLALALVAVLGPSLWNLILALTLTGWVGFARIVRAEVLYLKHQEFVQGALALGAGHLRVMFRHILPSLIGIMSVQVTLAMAGTILTESGLSFLGLGAPPEMPTWGALLSSGRRFLMEAPHLSLFPGFSIFLLVLGFQLMGIFLQEKFNVRDNLK